MKSCDRGRMEKGARLRRETATLANLQLHGTQRINTAICFMKCCVHQNVLNVYIQELCKLTSVVVLLLGLYSSSNFLTCPTLSDAAECIGIWKA